MAPVTRFPTWINRARIGIQFPWPNPKQLSPRSGSVQFSRTTLSRRCHRKRPNGSLHPPPLPESFRKRPPPAVDSANLAGTKPKPKGAGLPPDFAAFTAQREKEREERPKSLPAAKSPPRIGFCRTRASPKSSAWAASPTRPDIAACNPSKHPERRPPLS